MSALPGAPAHAYPATLHDLSLELLRGHDQDLNSLHEAGTGTEDPAESNNRPSQEHRTETDSNGQHCFLLSPVHRQPWDGKGGREYSGGDALRERGDRGDPRM